MTYQSILHCETHILRNQIAKCGKMYGLQITSDDLSVQIKGEAKLHDEFLSMFDHNDDVVIFLDNQHPNAVRDQFKTYCKFCPEIMNDRNVILERLSPRPLPPIGQFGRTASWYAKYYNFPTTDATPIIAIISLGGSYQTSDLVTYWKTICGLNNYPNVINVPVGQSSIPKYTGAGPDIENTLDLEIVGAVCPKSTLLFISAPNSFSGFYSAFATAINGVTIAGKKYQPSILSISWGAPEIIWTTPNLNAFNNLFGQAVAKGITIFVASGDNGSSDNYMTNKLPNVDFPSSSPNVIAVGGTTVTSINETVWSYNSVHKWGAGSGCSALFPMPSWQNGIAIFPTNTTPSVNFLSGKRVVPDIALSSDPLNGYIIYMGGKINKVGGTSCAAPLAAGLFGLMNFKYTTNLASHLYKIFTNPTQRNISYNDIILGSNDNLSAFTGVWNAGVGFDFCSGLGSVDGTNLFNVLKQLGLKSS